MRSIVLWACGGTEFFCSAVVNPFIVSSKSQYVRVEHCIVGVSVPLLRYAAPYRYKLIECHEVAVPKSVRVYITKERKHIDFP